MHAWTNKFLEELYQDDQYGSQQGTSTTHALINLTGQWIRALEKKRTVVRILLVDFRKAFDLVDHTILMQKLSDSGLPTFLV